MALTINTNVASLNAQRNLGKSQGQLNNSMQRLSSGLRINSAKDDAAGLAISDRMTAQIRGLNQASRNANDGISMAQTAEGALQETTNILQRMREIAVQASNGTNTTADRSSLDAEVSQLMEEVGRIASTTAFNGQTLLNGAFASGTGNATFQVGANAGNTISINIAAANEVGLGLETSNYTAATTGVTASATYVPTASATYSNISTGAGSGDGDWTLTASAVYGSVVATSATTGITASAVGTTTTVATFSAAQTAITTIDSALNSIDTIRGDLGAVQNRFESTISNLQNVSENLSAARSRILDADIAQETSNMTKMNILQQAGVSILAQANQAPQLALSLLG
jgi:flagellin